MNFFSSQRKNLFVISSLTIIFLLSFSVSADYVLLKEFGFPSNCFIVTNVSVTAELSVDVDEYYFNCSGNCNCNGFGFYSRINAVNNYLVTVTYVTKNESNNTPTPTPTPSGGSGGRGGVVVVLNESFTSPQENDESNLVLLNESVDSENNGVVTEQTTTTPTTTTESTNGVGVEATLEQSEFPWWILIILIIIGVALFALRQLIKKPKKREYLPVYNPEWRS